MFRAMLGCLVACWSKKYLSARSPLLLQMTVYKEIISIVRILTDLVSKETVCQVGVDRFELKPFVRVNHYDSL